LKKNQKLLTVGFAFALAIFEVAIGCNHDDRKPEVPIPAQSNVVYSPVLAGGGPGYMDIYRPSPDSPSPTPSARPAIVAIHGGGWISGHKIAVASVAADFANQGYVTFAPDYTIAPDAQWPAPLLDLQAQIRYLRANAAALEIDANRIGAWGFDAGGQLATMLALVDDPTVTTPPPPGVRSGGRVQCAVDVAGPTDLTILNGILPNEDQILTAFLGAPFDALPLSRLLGASCTSFARPDASVLIVHGTNDAFVSIENSEHLDTALTNVGGNVRFIRVYGGGHDASTYFAPFALSPTHQFFDEQLGK
jgi:acetyl esterase/lipase